MAEGPGGPAASPPAPVRVARLTAHPLHDRPYPPDPGADEHVQLSGGVGSSTGLRQVHMRVPPDQVEGAARRLLDAFRLAATEYPHQFEAWKRQRDQQRPDRQRRDEAEAACFQAIVDRLMTEHG